MPAPKIDMKNLILEVLFGGEILEKQCPYCFAMRWALYCSIAAVCGISALFFTVPFFIIVLILYKLK